MLQISFFIVFISQPNFLYPEGFHNFFVIMKKSIPLKYLG